MNEPEYRPDFYRKFLDSQLFIPHGNNPEEIKIENGQLAVGVGLKLPSIHADGQNWLPVFSSYDNLSKAIPVETRYIQLRGRDFLELVKGAHVTLNPGGFGKQLLPDEIDALLSGSIFNENAPRRIVTTKPEKILLGQPRIYPVKLVAALKFVFAGIPGVKAAYLAHCHMMSQSEPHTVIGIDTDDYDTVVVKIGPAVNSALEKNEIVDFISIRVGGSIASYMLKDTKPFYKPLTTSSVETPSLVAKANSPSIQTPAKKSFWKRWFGY